MIKSYPRERGDVIRCCCSLRVAWRPRWQGLEEWGRPPAPELRVELGGSPGFMRDQILCCGCGTREGRGRCTLFSLGPTCTCAVQVSTACTLRKSGERAAFQALCVWRICLLGRGRGARGCEKKRVERPSLCGAAEFSKLPVWAAGLPSRGARKGRRNV